MKPNNKSESCPYSGTAVLPEGMCPWLYHSVYPYMLGLIYGARFSYNEEGDSNAGCPAVHGVDTVVRRRDNDGSVDDRISDDTEWVVYAEVVRVGECPRGHKVGDRFVFPTCLREHYVCPAGFNNAFPLLDADVPPCIDRARVRCPDWVDENMVSYDVRESSGDGEEDH